MLDAVQRRRHARHLLLAEIGEQGQERLCAATVRLSDSPQPSAALWAQTYLERAGVGIDIDEGGRRLSLPANEALASLFGDEPLLSEAAAAVCGALTAVEVIKEVIKEVSDAAAPPSGKPAEGGPQEAQ